MERCFLRYCSELNPCSTYFHHFYYLDGVTEASHADNTVTLRHTVPVKQMSQSTFQNRLLFKGFFFNYKEINTGKCHILFSGRIVECV